MRDTGKLTRRQFENSKTVKTRLILALLYAPSVAFAQQADSPPLMDTFLDTFRTCAGAPVETIRLECYDNLASVLEIMDSDLPSDAPTEPLARVPEPSPTEQDTGKWRVSTSVNPMDDTTRVTAILTADSGRSRYGDPVQFVARCQSNTTEAYVIWHDYVGDDSRDVYSDWKYVTVRIGDAEAQRQRWNISTDKKATFAPDWAGALLKKLATEDKLALRMTPYGENPITALFDLRGTRAALAPLAETCNWEFAAD